MNNIGKKLLVVGTVISSLVYIVWRALFTLPFAYGTVAVFLGALLLLAEIIGFAEAANIYKGFAGKCEPEKPKIPDERFPEVDVFIATYNEPEGVLIKTINGCLNMDYPDKAKVHIHVCDDGGRKNIKMLADKMKVNYIQRDGLKNAKAGNYNNALKCTSAPLVATLDADMIPTHNFLMELVPYFFLDEYDKQGNMRAQKDEDLKIGFIQSPQSFYNTDLFQYNLYSEDKVPNEQNFFFRHVQLSRNSNNTAIYCGSNTILSRKALEEAGGFYKDSITEDLATGILIQSKGYKGYAVDTVCANGLSPTELSSLFKQRDRWARGCIQTFRRLPLFGIKGLSIRQKISFLFTVLYWYTPLRRCIFIMAPIFFSVFDIPVLDCSVKEIILFGLPHFILYNKALSGLTGKSRTARLSNIYDTILINLLPGILLETAGISKNSFSVTNKVRNLNKDDTEKLFAIKSALFPAFLLILSAIGIAKTAMQMAADGYYGYAVILFWLLINSYNILMALFFMLGRKTQRATERLAIHETIKISFCDEEIETESINISEGGTAFLLDSPYCLPRGRNLEIVINSSNKRYKMAARGTVVHVKKQPEGWRYAVCFTEIQEKDLLQLYGILYDREMPMPVHISEKSNFYKDLKDNISGRAKKLNLKNRLQPGTGKDPFGESGRCESFCQEELGE